MALQLPGIHAPAPPDVGEPIAIPPGAPVDGRERPRPPVQPPAPAPTPAPTPPKEPTESPVEPDTGSLPTFDKLALIIIIIGLILLAKALTDWLNWLFRVMLGPLWPRTGSKQISSQALTQNLSNTLGKFAQDFDPEVGTSFNQMAVTVGLASRAYVSLATRIMKLAVIAASLEGHAAQSIQTSNTLRHKQQVQQAQQADTQRQVAHQQVEARANAQHTDAAIHALNTHITTVLEPELARLKDRIHPLEQGQVTTAKQVQKHESALGMDAMVGTVAAAMGTLGATWTRCDTNREVGEALCGANSNTVRNLLKDLMPLIDIAALCSFISLISAMGKNPVLLDSLGVFSIGVNDLLKCTGATKAKPLVFHAVALAPTTPMAALAP